MKTLHFGNLAQNAAESFFQEAIAIYCCQNSPCDYEGAKRARMGRHFVTGSGVVFSESGSEVTDFSADYLRGTKLVMEGE